MTARPAINPDPAIAALEARVRVLEEDARERASLRGKKQRQRERRATGQRQFTIWANEDELAEKLARSGFLDRLALDQPDRISEALQAAVDGLALDPVPLRHSR